MTRQDKMDFIMHYDSHFRGCDELEMQATRERLERMTDDELAQECEETYYCVLAQQNEYNDDPYIDF